MDRLLVLEDDDLCDASWEAIGEVVSGAGAGDDKALAVAARLFEALGPRDYVLLLESGLGGGGGGDNNNNNNNDGGAAQESSSSGFAWVVREMARGLSAMSARAAMHAGPPAAARAMAAARGAAGGGVCEALSTLAESLARRAETSECGARLAVRVARRDGSDARRLVRVLATAGLDLDALERRSRETRETRAEVAAKHRVHLDKYRAAKAELRAMKEEDEDDDPLPDDVSESADSASSEEETSWSSTGASRLFARLELEAALPAVWSPARRGRLASHAARLLTRGAAREGCFGCARDGADLALKVAPSAPQDAALRGRLARRILRVATAYSDPQARALARKALMAVLGSTANPRIREDILRALLDSTGSLVPAAERERHFASRGEAAALADAAGPSAGCVLDCLRPDDGDIVAQALATRLDALLADGRVGYDALHANLDAHLAALALARRVLLAPPPPQTPQHRNTILDRETRLGNLADVLRRRLRRPREAARKTQTPDPRPAVSTKGEAAIHRGEETHGRFLLNLVAENLDYLLQDLNNTTTSSSS